MGHEAAGTIVQVGRNVRRLRKGDRLAIGADFPCGQCRWCRDGLPLTKEDDIAFGSPADTFFLHGQPRTNFDGTRVASSGYRRALVKGRLKLIVDTCFPLELYDIQADPRDLHNLAASPAHAAIREELLLDLFRWSIRLDDNAHVRRYTVKTAPSPPRALPLTR